MSGLAAAYTSTFRPVQPLQGAVISELAASILGSQPMETARLQAGLMNTGLGMEGQLIGTTLTPAAGKYRALVRLTKTVGGTEIPLLKARGVVTVENG
jgi:hypothetical protein